MVAWRTRKPTALLIHMGRQASPPKRGYGGSIYREDVRRTVQPQDCSKTDCHVVHAVDTGIPTNFFFSFSTGDTQ
jgi:hypothetical protein